MNVSTPPGAAPGGQDPAGEIAAQPEVVGVLAPAAGIAPPMEQVPQPAPVTGSRTLTLALVFSYFGIWLAFFSPVILTVPLRVADLSPGDETTTLSIVLGGSAIFGFVAGPLAGRLSDRSTSRFGRRRPYILGAFLVGLVGVLIEAFGPSLVLFFIGFSLGGVGFAAATSVILATLPEHIPAGRRGRVSGLLGVGQAISVVIGVVLAAALTEVAVAVAFVVPALVGLGLILFLCAVLPDVPHRTPRARLTRTEIAGSFWVDPRRNPDFGWAWLSRFMLFMAFAGITNYQVYYLMDQLGLAEADTGAVVGAGTGVQVLMTILGSLVSGRLSDRLGRRKVFVMASAGVGVLALLLLATATTVPVYVAAMALNGLANGVYYAIDLALVTDILPERRTNDGRDLGVFGLANQLPQTLAPALAPAFLAIGIGSVTASGDNYTALFAASALFALISAVAITRVRGTR